GDVPTVGVDGGVVATVFSPGVLKTEEVPHLVIHHLAHLIGFRMHLIAAGDFHRIAHGDARLVGSVLGFGHAVGVMHHHEDVQHGIQLYAVLADDLPVVQISVLAAHHVVVQRIVIVLIYP